MALNALSLYSKSMISLSSAHNSDSDIMFAGSSNIPYLLLYYIINFRIGIIDWRSINNNFLFK